MLFYGPGFLRPATTARQCVLWHNKKVNIEAQHNPITLYESSDFDDLTSMDFDHSLTIQLIKNDTNPSEWRIGSLYSSGKNYDRVSEMGAQRQSINTNIKITLSIEFCHSVIHISRYVNAFTILIKR